MMNGLEGKVGIVVGGASGLGKAISYRLAHEGVRVAVADVNLDGATTVADEIAKRGGEAEPFQVDLRDEESVNALVQATVDRFGGVQLLDNVALDTRFVVEKDFDILTTDLSVLDEIFALTLRGYVATCRAAIPHMLEAGGGAIVNTSSGAVQRALNTGQRHSYAMAKSGLGPLSQHICTKFGMDGIRANTMVMGLILSEGLLGNLTPERVSLLRSLSRNKDHGDPDALAAVAAFLLSDDARMLNGQSINVDGGSSASN